MIAANDLTIAQGGASASKAERVGVFAIFELCTRLLFKTASSPLGMLAAN